MRTFAFIYGLCLIVLLSSCKQESLTRSDYYAWISNPDNGLRVIRTMDEYEFAAQIVPPALQALRMYGPSFNREQLAEVSYKANGLLDIQLQIGTQKESAPILTHKLNNQQAYQERVSYYAFELEKQIYLQIGQRTLRPHSFHFEQGYNLAQHINCFVSFELPDTLTDNPVLIVDNQELNTGPLHFPFTSHALAHIPDLQL